MKLNRESRRKLKHLNINKKREVLKQLAINNDLSEMYLDVCHFTDEEVKQAYDKLLNDIIKELENGGK
ncbi:MAG: hypothetical protein HFG48_03385 [Bacilli bacterium]|nr:hypothetical protein [Bacilli bacterium]